LLILVQRGRGGGLAGALGGMGGSSAFGAKAGDVFTRITVVTAAIWILLSLFALLWANHRGDVLGTAAPADSALDVLPQASPDAKSGEPTAPPAGTKEAGPASSSPPAADEAAPATKE
jgi:preprotein translocase subunit SecG